MEINFRHLKFIYSENATKFCEISTLLVSMYIVPVKSKVERFCKILWPFQNIWTLKSNAKAKMENSSNFLAFSENLNFNQVIKTQLVYFYTHCHVKFGGNLVSDKLFIGSIKKKSKSCFTNFSTTWNESCLFICCCFTSNQLD